MAVTTCRINVKSTRKIPKINRSGPLYGLNVSRDFADALIALGFDIEIVQETVQTEQGELDLRDQLVAVDAPITFPETDADVVVTEVQEPVKAPEVPPVDEVPPSEVSETEDPQLELKTMDEYSAMTKADLIEYLKPVEQLLTLAEPLSKMTKAEVLAVIKEQIVDPAEAAAEGAGEESQS